MALLEGISTRYWSCGSRVDVTEEHNLGDDVYHTRSRSYATMIEELWVAGVLVCSVSTTLWLFCVGTLVDRILVGAATGNKKIRILRKVLFNLSVEVCHPQCLQNFVSTSL